jgi:hypothetical protein
VTAGSVNAVAVTMVRTLPEPHRPPGRVTLLEHGPGTTTCRWRSGDELAKLGAPRDQAVFSTQESETTARLLAQAG